MSKRVEPTKEVRIKSEEVYDLYHELANGVGVIRTAFNRIAREGCLDSQSLTMYEGGLKKLVSSIEKIETNYLEKGS